MNLIFCILLGIVAVFLLLIFGYDSIIEIIEKYSHFHIGRWKNILIWKKAVEKKAKKWMIYTPELRLRDDNRYLLIDKITGKSGKNMVQSWQKAGCILGVSTVESSNILIKRVQKRLIDSKGNWKIQIDKIDYALLAYSILKVETNVDSIKPAMDSMIECIENNICEDGMISYSGGKESDRRYVDTLGFVCPFLSLYGKTFNKPEYIDMAVNQIRSFDKFGFYKSLPVHCFQYETNLPLGVYGWGRGIGWYTLALTETYNSVQTQFDKEYIELRMSDCAHKWSVFERKAGGFSTIVQVKNGHYDSSATAMIGHFYATCGKVFVNEAFLQIANRCLEQLIKHTKINGVIDGCLGDTKDLGVFSQKYSSMPFVQGLALILYAELNTK